jgi:hypothetical protein
MMQETKGGKLGIFTLLRSPEQAGITFGEYLLRPQERKQTITYSFTSSEPLEKGLVFAGKGAPS